MEENQVNGYHENGVETEVKVNGTSAEIKVNGTSAEIKFNGTPAEFIKTNGTSAEPARTFDIPTAKLVEINFTPYMRGAVDKVAQANGFQDFDVQIIHGSGVGDGFVGLVFKVTIQEKGSDKKLNVILKSPPDSLARRNDFGAMGLFRREVYAYNVLLPEFVAFQEEKGIKSSEGFFNFPMCYFAEYDEEKDESVIIMEDLRESGYKMWNKMVPHNFEHTKFLMTALGRLHAISFAMKAQKPELFEKFKNLNDLLTEKMMDDKFIDMLKASIDRAIDTIDVSDVKRRNRASKLKDNMGQVLQELVSGLKAEPFAIVGHGDCWSNNFMYHYKRGSPQKICLLDWQVSRYGSPALDLAYFFFICTDAEMRSKHYDELLNIYHRSLKDLLDHLGGDTMSQFPFTALLRQLKQFGKFGVFMSILIMPMITTQSDQLIDMDFLAENMNKDDPEMMAEMIKKFQSSNDAHPKRMNGVLLDAIRYGYL